MNLPTEGGTSYCRGVVGVLYLYRTLQYHTPTVSHHRLLVGETRLVFGLASRQQAEA